VRGPVHYPLGELSAIFGVFEKALIACLLARKLEGNGKKLNVGKITISGSRNRYSETKRLH
jgi:hypothetical protein